jgi:hypothetical protein
LLASRREARRAVDRPHRASWTRADVIVGRVKYGATRVTIIVDRDGDNARLRVRDDGPGSCPKGGAEFGFVLPLAGTDAE